MTPTEPNAPDPRLDGKTRAAEAGLAYVKDGMVVGLGSGSTAEIFITLLGQRVKAGLSIRAIATSQRSAQLARAAGIELTDFEHISALDLAIDGADEVDPKLDLLKGHGGALLFEKIVAEAAREVIILVDASKCVPALGQSAVPVEVVPFALPLVRRRLEGLGALVTLRCDAQGPYVTEAGHAILDALFNPLEEAAALVELLDVTPGVVEHGLFLGMANRVIVAGPQGLRTLTREELR